MTFSRHQRAARAQEQAAAIAAHNAANVSPDPDGNRAQRRAWAKLTKRKTPAPPTPEGNPA